MSNITKQFKNPIILNPVDNTIYMDDLSPLDDSYVYQNPIVNTKQYSMAASAKSDDPLKLTEVFYNSSGRAGVIPKLYFGKGVNDTAASTKAVVLTGEGAEVYVEAGGTIRKGDRVAFEDSGKVKAWTTGIVVGHYVGHYGEASGAGEPPTDAISGEAIRIRLGGN
jgi:hypothetical protein